MAHRSPFPASGFSRRSALTGAGLAAAGWGLGSRRGAAARDATPAASARSVTTESGVVFAAPDGRPLLLDVYAPPPRAAPRPAVITIHGGAWTTGIAGPIVMVEAATELAAAGYVVFNISYRLLTGAPGENAWPAQLDDCQQAVRWVRANAAGYGVDPDRVASFGGSSGGHLAALLGVRDTRADGPTDLAGFSSRVDAVVDLAGDADLTIPYPAAFDQQSVTNLLGGTAAEKPDAYRDASPVSWVDANTAPFLIVHSAQDEVNPVEHSLRLAEALHRAEIASTFVELDRGGHLDTFGWDVCGPWALTFLGIELRPDR